MILTNPARIPSDLMTLLEPQNPSIRDVAAE